MSVPSIYRCPCIADFPPCHFYDGRPRSPHQFPLSHRLLTVIMGTKSKNMISKIDKNSALSSWKHMSRWNVFVHVCFFSALGFLHINIVYIYNIYIYIYIYCIYYTSMYSNHFISFQSSNQLFPFCHFLLLCIARRGWRRSWRISSERKTRSDCANLFERALWMGLDEWRGWLMFGK